MLPDSCKATVRNGNSIRYDFTEDSQKRLERRLFLFLLDNLTDILVFLTFQVNHNVKQMLAVHPVSKARSNKLYIFRQCTYIVYLFHLVVCRFLSCACSI